MASRTAVSEGLATSSAEGRTSIGCATGFKVCSKMASLRNQSLLFFEGRVTSVSRNAEKRTSGRVIGTCRLTPALTSTTCVVGGLRAAGKSTSEAAEKGGKVFVTTYQDVKRSNPT